MKVSLKCLKSRVLASSLLVALEGPVSNCQCTPTCWNSHRLILTESWVLTWEVMIILLILASTHRLIEQFTEQYTEESVSKATWTVRRRATEVASLITPSPKTSENSRGALSSSKTCKTATLSVVAKIAPSAKQSCTISLHSDQSSLQHVNLDKHSQVQQPPLLTCRW